MSSSSNCPIEIIIQQRKSPIDKFELDEIRSERRLATSHLHSQVSAISPNDLDELVYQRRNALVKEVISMPTL